MSFGPTHARSRQVSAGIVEGVHFLMKKNKITEIDGWGTLTSPTSMDVALNAGDTQTVTFDKLIIATGATTRICPGTPSRAASSPTRSRSSPSSSPARSSSPGRARSVSSSPTS